MKNVQYFCDVCSEQISESKINPAKISFGRSDRVFSIELCSECTKNLLTELHKEKEINYVVV